MNENPELENSFYTSEELSQLGFKSIGKNVKLSRKASYYGRSQMSFGHNSRVDDFTVLSGPVIVGCYVHISNNATIIAGQEPVEIGDFATISFGCRIFSKSDEFTGSHLLNPTVPQEFNVIINKKVTIGRTAAIGANSIVLPGVAMADGSSLGAGSFLNKSTEYCGQYLGTPARKIGVRPDTMLAMADEVLRRDLSGA